MSDVEYLIVTVSCIMFVGMVLILDYLKRILNLLEHDRHTPQQKGEK